MKSCVFFILIFSVSSILAEPKEENPLMVRGTWQAEVFANIRQLIEQLTLNIQTAATDAFTAILTFEGGLIQQANLVREKLITELQKLQDRITEAINNVLGKVTNSGTAVRECIEAQRIKAEEIFNTTITTAFECIDKRVEEISGEINKLNETSNGALEYAESVVAEMQKCLNDNSGNLIHTGKCLGAQALKAEIKGAQVISSIAMQIGRINIAIATLPLGLEVCIGNQLVSAGFATATLIVDIGKCSAAAIFPSG